MIHYKSGDATRPEGEGQKLICHICNDAGGWGAGFVLAISKRWKEPERCYRDAWSMRQHGRTFYLGAVQIVKCTDDISVANMVAQKGYSRPGKPALEYPALETCLGTVAYYLRTHPASIHMPRIGCGLAGGSWDEVEKLIQKKLGQYDVHVYDLPQTQPEGAPK